ncbi:MAG: 4-hydroxyphenylpyruvate dioxygenase [Burkholderiales bacterium]|nr:4-hydroxyphenylpyruvate dioxygenase [Burkholderiales bacterium]
MTASESNPEPSNPLGVDGIEYVEYATARPQALGAVLEQMGFAPVARHRSREVMLYRQGTMNLIVNAHPDMLAGLGATDGTPVIAAIALRVRDAAYAWSHSTRLGAWPRPATVSAMELNIPAIQGVGGTLIYFVDRYRDFSIYDVDFVPLPSVERHPPAVAGLHYFGVVQTIGAERTDAWLDFYGNLFGFTVLPPGTHFGILPKGTLLESPCRKFYLQLIEPLPGADDVAWDEGLTRIGLGAPDVVAATAALKRRGVVFVDREPVQPSDKGALTQGYLGSVSFELVASHIAAAAEDAR